MPHPAPAQAGFEGRIGGRDGSIVYREPGRELELFWEVSAAPRCDISVGPVDFSKWTRPPGERIPEEKQLELLSQLRLWFSEQKIRTDVHLPEDMSQDEAPCSWLACDCHKLRHSAYCRRHFDLMCLRLKPRKRQAHLARSANQDEDTPLAPSCYGHVAGRLLFPAGEPRIVEPSPCGAADRCRNTLHL